MLDVDNFLLAKVTPHTLGEIPYDHIRWYVVKLMQHFNAFRRYWLSLALFSFAGCLCALLVGVLSMSCSGALGSFSDVFFWFKYILRERTL